MTDLDIRPMSKANIVVYKSGRAFVKAFSKVWFRFSVTGLENIPQDGGFILAPGGHRSYLDTPITGLLSNRIPRFMGAHSYFDKPLLGRFLYSMGGFPIEREATDRDSMNKAQALLESGQSLVIFPEGARFSGPVIDSAKLGAAFLACRAQVPIVPVGLGGMERAMPKGAFFVKPTKCAGMIGKPIYPPKPLHGKRVKRSQITTYSEEVFGELQSLFDAAQNKCGISQ